jgi:hypothetical protein
MRAVSQRRGGMNRPGRTRPPPYPEKRGEKSAAVNRRFGKSGLKDAVPGTRIGFELTMRAGNDATQADPAVKITKKATMKKAAIIFCAVLLIACGGGNSATPETYEDLAAAYRAAHEAKDLSRIGALVFWGSIPKEEQDAMLERIKHNTFDYAVTGTKITDMAQGVDLQNDSYRFPLTPEKELSVDFKPLGGKSIGHARRSVYSLGMKDGRPYIVFMSEPVK